MRDVYFGNAKWSQDEPAMAKIEMLEFSVSLRDLPEKILVPRVALTRPELVFERLPDNRKNWILSDPSDTSPSKLRISTLSVDHGHLRYSTTASPSRSTCRAAPSIRPPRRRCKDADAKPQNNRYTTQYDFKGNYHDAAFSGRALTGDVLSFQESGVPFPLKGGSTRARRGSRSKAPSPTPPTSRPSTPNCASKARRWPTSIPSCCCRCRPRRRTALQGHLILKGNRYTMDDLAGKIGSTDVTGKGAYVDKKPRPLLTADLHSKLLNLADLGPLIGVQTKESGGKPAASQAETSSRPAAKAKEKAIDPNHLLPAGTFDGSRLQKIDAEVDLVATKLVVPDALPLESLKASLRLHDSMLKVAPLDFGFAGGTIASQVALDAREPTLKSDVQIDLQRVRVDELVPDSKTIAKGAGRVGATLHLKGTGNSIADAAAKADGRIAATVVNGRISNLLDAASGLNGGKVLTLLAGGDKDIVIRCGGVAFRRHGRARQVDPVRDRHRADAGARQRRLRPRARALRHHRRAEAQGGRPAVAAHAGAPAWQLQAARLRDREGPAARARRRCHCAGCSNPASRHSFRSSRRARARNRTARGLIEP